VERLQEANDLEGTRLVPGQTLRIPDCGARRQPQARPEEEPATGGEVAPVDDDAEAASGDVDTTTLPALMADRGFQEPEGGFLAYVIEIPFGEGRTSILGERRFDYAGTSEDASGWNPASTVKLYAAVAALLRIRELGFDREATLTFRAAEETPSFTLGGLVEAAVGPSENLAYDYLAAFVGFDLLHERFFTAEHGFRRTALRVAYDLAHWERLGFSKFLRDSPAVAIEQDGRTEELPERVGRARVHCHQATCTTLRELAETLRRVMLQEAVPEGESFGLGDDDLRFLRDLLASERPRGQEVVRALAPHFGSDAVLYHKAGFAGDWYTDVVYIDDAGRDRAWVVALSGNPGRSCLDQAADIVGEILATGALGP
jgi:hypothetical protein